VISQIAYASKLLNNVEKNYTTIERETLAMVYVLHKFRHYLFVYIYIFRGIAIPCQKTSIVKANYKVDVVIPRIQFFDGVQTNALSFGGGCSLATS
jgi:hypothetical protein